MWNLVEARFHGLARGGSRCALTGSGARLAQARAGEGDCGAGQDYSLASASMNARSLRLRLGWRSLRRALASI